MKKMRRLDDVEIVNQEVQSISKDEVRAAVGLDNIPVEGRTCLGERAVKFLTRLFNKIFGK